MARRSTPSGSYPFDPAKARAFLDALHGGSSLAMSLRLAGLNERTLWVWLRRAQGPTTLETGKPVKMPPKEYSGFRTEFAGFVVDRARRAMSDDDE